MIIKDNNNALKTMLVKYKSYNMYKLESEKDIFKNNAC